MKILTLSLLVVLLVAGCVVSPATPRNLTAAGTEYNTTIRVLSAHVQGGILSAREADDLTPSVQACLEALNEWHDALIQGRSPAEAIRKYNTAMNRLSVARDNADKRARESRPSHPERIPQ